jgi:nondiscriminating aspartyl-tRNA synthetase
LERVLSADLKTHVGRRVTLMGSVHHQRQLGQISFLLVRDRTGVAQVVVEDEAMRAVIARLRAETAVAVTGDAVASDQAPAGVELHNATVEVLAEPVADLPIELRRPFLKEHLPTLLDHAAVSLRHPMMRARWRLAAASLRGFRTALDERGFTEIQTPKLVPAATEGGANVFSVDYFGRTAYLAQSPQFYKQTMVGVFERVYEVGPVFRAEPHDTARHLAEYVSLDVELGFIRDHRDVMALLRAVLASMAHAMASSEEAALGLLELEVPPVPDPIPEIDFVEAQRLIEAATGEAVVGEPDLAPAHERWLGERTRREHGSDFVFVTGYPMAKRPFYTHPSPDDPERSNSFDLIFRGVELVTGGQRLHRYDDYVAALAVRGLDPEPFASYLDAARYGLPPHGGFAIGLERWVASVTGVHNIREVTLFPRDIHRLAP